ncbi:hypothetical protein J6590_065587 [Homalodisca vitripennis]|nr:hypothetical protein J6590_065587 [Homalodisca vitripennis]
MGQSSGRILEVEEETSRVPTTPKKPTFTEPKPRENKRRRQPDEVELKMIKTLEEQSPHISYIQVLLPHLHKFDDSEILEFQMGVLDVMKKIDNKRKQTAQLQLLPPPTSSYYPNNYPFPQYQSCRTSQLSYPNQFIVNNSLQSQQPHNHPKFINCTKIEIKIHKIPITAIQTTSRHALRKDSHLNINNKLHNTIKILATRQQPHLQRTIHRRALLQLNLLFRSQL